MLLSRYTFNDNRKEGKDTTNLMGCPTHGRGCPTHARLSLDNQPTLGQAESEPRACRHRSFCWAGFLTEPPGAAFACG